MTTLRKAFLDAVDRHIPEVHRELVKIARTIPRDKNREGEEPNFDELLRKDGRFAAWATRWGFTDPWLLRIVARNTAYEIWQGRARPWLCGQALLIPEDLPIEIAPWTHGETEAMFQKRVERAVRACVKARRRQMIQSGLDTPRKRAPKHFAHLALIHVKGLNYKAVADWQGRRASRGVDENTIRKGVVNAAMQIGLTLRAPKAGRPRKKLGNQKS